MGMVRSSLSVLLSTVAIGALHQAPAQAQEAPSRQSDASATGASAPASTSSGNVDGEIVVTAQKRTERLQDVPISLAVIGGQDLERRSAVGMEDYLRSIPGVNQIDRGGVDNAVVIRGITTSPQAENFNSGTTVATYFGETPITGSMGFGSGGGVDIRPVDLERIEILRGPQGTAYGASSVGGMLRLIPAAPKLSDFEGKVAASYSHTGRLGGDNTMIQGVANLPVVKDTFAIRAVLYRFDESGYYRNIAGDNPATIALVNNFGLPGYVDGYVQNDVGQMVSHGGRFSALWRPTDRLDFSVNYLRQEIEQKGRPEVTVGKYDQVRLPIAPQTRLDGYPGEISTSQIDVVSGTVNYDFGWADATSTASWVDSGSQQNAQATFLAYPASTTVISAFNSFSTESRLATKFDGPLQLLGGIYYENLREDFLNTTDWPGAPRPSPTHVTNPVSISDRSRHTEQYAAFAELSYDLTDHLTVTGGGRYFKYERSELNRRREGGLFGVPIGGSIPSTLVAKKDGSIFKLNLSYKPSSDAHIYGSWSQGFRLGRGDVGLSSAVCDVNPRDGLIDGTDLSIESTRTVNSDFIDQYEVGAKFALFGRRLTIDAAAFHITWDGLPFRTNVNCNGTLSQYTANAGSATSTGFEFQAAIRPTDNLKLEVGMGYTDAKLSEDAPALNAPKGARLPGAPKFNANFAAEYGFEIAGNPAFVRADAFYAGSFYGDLLQTPLTRAGDYVKIDARAGVEVNNISLEVFARNLTNDDSYTWRGLSNVNTAFGYRQRPRTVGVQVGYRF